MRHTTQKVQVTLTIGLQYSVRDVGKKNLKALIEEAVRYWGGSLCPDDLLFDAVSSVKAGRVDIIS